jgi:hypothetical protein
MAIAIAFSIGFNCGIAAMVAMVRYRVRLAQRARD